MMNKYPLNWESTKSFTLAFFLMVVGGTLVMKLNTSVILSWNLLIIESMNMAPSLLLDQMNLYFNALVLLISMSVMMFSNFYMSTENEGKKFYHMLTLFICSMIIFVSGGDLIFILLGWDGLGITSFILVMFFQNMKSLGGSMVTLFTNRVGDAFFILGLASMVSAMDWVVPLTSSTPETLFIMMFIGATTKSAQMPFSMWLPEAMAAPTPVSALVHSSTLVTAGIFLVVRFLPLLLPSMIIMSLTTMLGAMTLVGGGLWATFTKDTKKIVALSTLSHLGIMMVAISTGWGSLAFIHLMAHATFKALLFICVGVDITSKLHVQNLSSNQLQALLCTWPTAKFISLCSLNALPFMAGFLSKDLIFEVIMMSEQWEPLTLLFIGSTTSSIYSMRLWTMTSSLSTSQVTHLNLLAPETHLFMSKTPMSVASIMTGALMHPLFAPMNPMISPLEHLTPLISVVIGVVVFISSNQWHGGSISKSMGLQKPITKSLALSIMTSSKLMISVNENGLNHLSLPTSMKMLAVCLSNLILSQQSSPPNSMLLTSTFLLLMPLLTL